MSKLNPNAGEWVPTFSTPAASSTKSLSPVEESAPSMTDQTPVQNEAKAQIKETIDMSSNSKNALERAIDDRSVAENGELISYEGYSPISNRFIYSKKYLLRFQPLGDRGFKSIPDIVKNPTPPKELGSKVKGTLVYTRTELLQFQPLYEMMPRDFTWADTIGADAVMDEGKGKRGKKDKFCQRPGVESYDASLACYFNPTEYATAMNMGLYTGPSVEKTGNTLDGKSKLSITETINPVEEAIIAKRRIATLLNDERAKTVTTILDAFMEITISCIHTLEEIVGYLFDHAIANPELSDFYAKLCTGMSERTPEFKDGAKTINFRRILLTKCYESLVEEPENPPFYLSGETNLGSNGAMQHSWRRKCMLQNVGLMGELFRRQLLTENIMHVCVAMMLDDEIKPQAEIIEAACGLLHLIGDLLDGSSPASRRMMDEYFALLVRIYENCELPDCVKKMMNDLKTMRAGGWIKSRQETLPTSITPVVSPAKINPTGTNKGDSVATVVS